MWEADDSLSMWTKGHRYERKIGSLADIVQSQKKHYFKANGRTLVHSAEQAMSGRRGFVFFCFFNTAVFLTFIWLVVRYTCDAVPWILAVLALLYLMPFQRTLWTSINYGPNYLWPSVLTVALLAAWRRVAAAPRRRGMYVAAAVLAAVAALAVVAPQTVICRDTLKVYRFQHALVQSYCRSEDGLVLCDEPPVSDFTRPYIRLWELPPTPYTEIFSIEQVYGQYCKPSVYLNAADYNAVADTAAFYATAHRVPGDAGAYAADGGAWMWLRPGTFSRGERFRLKLAHVGLTSDDPIDSKIQRIAWPLAWQDSYTSKVDTVRTRYGEAYRIAIPRRRKLLELNRVDGL